MVSNAVENVAFRSAKEAASCQPNSDALATLLVFSDDWGRHPSSCQHLMRQLLDRYNVIWVNTIGTRAPRLDMATLSRAAGKLKSWIGPSSVAQRPVNHRDKPSGGAALPVVVLVRAKRAGIMLLAPKRYMHRARRSSPPGVLVSCSEEFA